MRKLVKRIVLYTKLDEGENNMTFKRKRDFEPYSEIRQEVFKKIENLYHNDSNLILKYDKIYRKK